MSKDSLKDASKFMSYVLRHNPESIGIALSSEGWIPISELVHAALLSGHAIDRQTIEQIVETSDKKRFSISDDGLNIRAAQGHTTAAVAIKHTEKTPPETLFHGTATRFVPSIREHGLLPGQRHHVHLTDNHRVAEQTGSRHGEPVVLVVQAASMSQHGHHFYIAENGVWLVRAVPPEFLS